MTYVASESKHTPIIPGGAMPIYWPGSETHASMVRADYGDGLDAHVTLCGLDIPQNDLSRPRREWGTVIAGDVDCPVCLTVLTED